VAPPHRHVEIGRSVARALAGADLVSFEHVLLERAEREEKFHELEEAELYNDRAFLAAWAEETLLRLIAQRGGPGKIVVLADTAVLGVCDAHHLVRRLYNEVMSGSRGFWVVVIPGVISQSQPLFNEKTPVFRLDGLILPLNEEIPEEVHG